MQEIEKNVKYLF